LGQTTLNYCVRCRKPVPKPKRGPHSSRCNDCKRKFEQGRQHRQYLKRKFKGYSESERQLEELKADIIRDNHKIARFLDWKHHHLQRFAFSATDKNEARRKLREREENGGFYGEPLWQPKKKQVNPC
jgi:hypothetical protein